MSANKEIKILDEWAYTTKNIGCVVLNNQYKGYRVSERARHNLIESSSGRNVCTVIYDKEIVWVSKEEFKSNGFVEHIVKSEKG